MSFLRYHLLGGKKALIQLGLEFSVKNKKESSAPAPSPPYKANPKCACNCSFSSKIDLGLPNAFKMARLSNQRSGKSSIRTDKPSTSTLLTFPRPDTPTLKKLTTSTFDKFYIFLQYLLKWSVLCCTACILIWFLKTSQLNPLTNLVSPVTSQWKKLYFYPGEHTSTTEVTVANRRVDHVRQSNFS